MPIVEKTQTADEIAAGNEVGVKTREKLAEKIKGGDVFKSLNIPTEEEEVVEEQQESTEEEEVVDEEDAEEEATEDEAVEEEESAEDDAGDEDMVPKSKVQPRIDRLKSQIKALEAKIESQAINRRTEEAEKVDETTAKLRKMGPEELKTLKREVRVAQIEAKDDKKKLNELLDLEDKIDETVRTAPVRFNNAQINAYNKKADEIASDPAIKNIEVAAPKIVAMAKEIYARYPKLHNDVEGQAIALELAVDKYKELSKYSLTRGSVQNLKSQVNKLKQKTSLDNRSSKSTGDSTVIDNLRRQAANGTTKDKVNLVKSDPRFNVDSMIPAEYK